MKCQRCNEEADELFRTKVGHKTLKLCEYCADEVREEEEISASAETNMQNMMEYKER
ncbi:MAG: hypothetical protein JW841_16290 [Deltaproteobacteria bacterium]|nr:hypothetical protein [Deltaproteobacteria bacterium]